ncbi:tail completion protein gp17 [Lentilitoribacter sp. EG35]|uniref:tail completion protein gp17 n=1 Tax=Lentilitoribacter sp. EG35 TaxID=3234192 RepID=UPI003460A28F
MEEALIALLLADSGLAALVGSRVFIGQRPQNKSDLPAVLLSKVSAPRDYHMAGPSNLIQSRFQCDCYGDDYRSAKLTARALMSVVNGYKGTQSGVVVQLISIDGERDGNETESAADRHLFRTSIDLLIWHDE